MSVNTMARPSRLQQASSLFWKSARRDVLAISPTTNIFLNLLLLVACILTLIPIYVIVISSITSESSLAANGYRLWPEEFSGLAYTFLFSQGIIRARNIKGEPVPEER
jgi:ABC-type glycerol-3-phosphate transport system permease component